MNTSPYTKAEQDFLGQVAGFAARHAVNQVFMTTVYSKTVNAPVLMIIALGEQASALQHLVMENRVKEPGIEVVSSLDSTSDDPKW